MYFYMFLFIQSLRAFRRPTSLVPRPVFVVSFGACGLLCLVGRFACRVLFLSSRLLFVSFFLLLFLSSAVLVLLSSSALLSFALLLFFSSALLLLFLSPALLLFFSCCRLLSLRFSSSVSFFCSSRCFGFLGTLLSSWGRLGASFGTLFGLFGPLETLLDASWRHLGLRRHPKVRRINGWKRFGVDFGSFLVPFLRPFGLIFGVFFGHRCLVRPWRRNLDSEGRFLDGKGSPSDVKVGSVFL